jgi:type IV pilus assembly protein PilC
MEGYRQMATMMGTGVPIVQSLNMVSDNHNKAEIKSILSQVTKAVEAGTPISKALSTSSSHFDGFYTQVTSRCLVQRELTGF